MLLAAIDEAYDARSWHGTNLRGSLRGVTPEQAAWRPGSATASTFAKAAADKAGQAADAHNIWELMVHAAYWKYDIRRRLTGDEARLVRARRQ